VMQTTGFVVFQLASFLFFFFLGKYLIGNYPEIQRVYESLL